MHLLADTRTADPAAQDETGLPLGNGRGERSAHPVRHPRQLDHDIQHELGTIALLASLVGAADDVGPDSRRRAQQIVDETQWLSQLVRAASSRAGHVRSDVSGRYLPSMHADPPGNTDRFVRLDRIANDVVAAARLSTYVTVHLEAGGIWAPVDPLAFWRVLTNLVDNAIRAAGAHGEVRVRVFATDSRAVVHVEDDGPGFGAGPPGSGAHGLDIVRELVESMAGELQIGTAARGGCRVQLCMPALPSGLTKGFSPGCAS
jgi:signal transduction histidine kinase